MNISLHQSPRVQGTSGGNARVHFFESFVGFDVVPIITVCPLITFITLKKDYVKVHFDMDASQPGNYKRSGMTRLAEPNFALNIFEFISHFVRLLTVNIICEMRFSILCILSIVCILQVMKSQLFFIPTARKRYSPWDGAFPYSPL